MTHYFKSYAVTILAMEPGNIFLNNRDIFEKEFLIQIVWAKLGQ